MTNQGDIHLSASKKVSYINGFPLVGNLLDYRKDHLDVLRRLADTGDVAGMHFGPLPVLMFNKPEYVYSVLVEHDDDFDKGHLVHAVFGSVMGPGLVSLESDAHRRHRKLIAPSFQPRHISAYAHTIGNYGERLQRTWRSGSTVDVNQSMSTLTYNTIGKVLFDADDLAEKDGIVTAMATIIEYISHSLSAIVSPPYYWPLPHNIRTKEAVHKVSDVLQSFIDEHRTNETKHNDMLTLMLDARDDNGAAMSDEELITECLTLFGAGQGTTIATALTWAWYLLCQHPHVYDKVQQELDGVLQGRTPTYEDLTHLPYCLQVYKETLRLYPPVYATSRRALRSVEINGYAISKGQAILIAPYTLHRRSDAFPAPEMFDPDRFSPEREKQLPRHAFMPFGAGPRICIGMYFSLMEGHLLLATLAQRVRFSLVPGQTITPDPIRHLTLRPYGAVNMLVTRR